MSAYDATLARLRDLCAGDGKRLDLLEAALTLSLLHRDDAIDLAPLRQHVTAMTDSIADLVHRRGANAEALGEVIASAYGYRGDNETYDDLQNADLARVIERRKGRERLPIEKVTEDWEGEGLGALERWERRATNRFMELFEQEARYVLEAA